MKKLILLALLIPAFSCLAFAETVPAEAKTQKKLDQIIQTQQQIVEQLKQLKEDINIVKIRATK